jgi:hypothetical protein
MLSNTPYGNIAIGNTAFGNNAHGEIEGSSTAMERYSLVA